jgi:hypothetical protein
MSKYQRSTRECSVSQFKPELQQALREYFQKHNLGELESEAVLCVETISEKKAGGWIPSWLDGNLDETVLTGIVLTTQSLIWARSTGDANQNLPGVRVVGAELMNIQAKAHVSQFSKDMGLEVNGLIEDSKGNIRGVLGLGPEPEALKFCDEVRQAIEKINPTPVRKWPTWMGGR